jgi:hypothetical protein
MSRRAGLLTKTQRKQLSRQGCSGCVFQIILLPFELLSSLFQGFDKAAKKQRRRKWPKGYQ